MRLGVVTRFADGHGQLVPKRGGGGISFTRAVCDNEPQRGSLVRFEASRQRRGPAIATVVEVLTNSGGASEEVSAEAPPISEKVIE